MKHDELPDGAKFRIAGYPNGLYQKMPWDKDTCENWPMSNRYTKSGCTNCYQHDGYGPSYIWNTLVLVSDKPYRVHFCGHVEVIPVGQDDD
jgi:hypothetical protein